MQQEVVPLVGTWIEIACCGCDEYGVVVPLVGTWIEIARTPGDVSKKSRAPRGHVD